MTPRDLIESARLRVWNRHPYTGSVLMSLRLVEHPGINTIAVDAGWRLHYDPIKIEEWGVELLAGVIAHECWHVLRDHFVRMGDRERELWNIAADCEINSDLHHAGWKLPDDQKTPKKYQLKDGLLAEEYYQLIKDQKNQKPEKSSEKPQRKCGGCSGNPHNWEESESPSENIPSPITQFEQTVIKRQAAQDVAEAAKRQGNVPKGLVDWAEKELKPPVIDWRKQLASHIRRAITHAAGAVDHTYRRPSRRGAGLRLYVGDASPIMPSLYRPVPSVAIILDVSGSMGGRPAEAARAEIIGVVRACGCSLDVFLADVKIAGRHKVSSVKDVAKMGETLGGTDLGSAIKEVDEKRKFDVLIVLTDGYTGWHNEGSTKATIIAAITPDGDNPPGHVRSVRMV